MNILMSEVNDGKKCSWQSSVKTRPSPTTNSAMFILLKCQTISYPTFHNFLLSYTAIQYSQHSP